MIRFCCEHCANKIGVRDKHAGKRGKCPTCGNVIVIPAESTVIEFHCENCDRKINVSKSHAGKKAICPQCNNTFIIPAIQSPGSAAKQNHVGDPTTRSMDSPLDSTLMDVPEEYKLKDPPAGESNVREEVIDRQQESEEDWAAVETESAARRKLPWIVDIFLYPISASGMIHLAFFWLGLLLIGLLDRFIFSRFDLGGLISMWLYILLFGYMFYYLTFCVFDSAKSGRRAPDISTQNLPDRAEFLSKLFLILACVAICFWPVAVYYIVTERSDLIYWLLLVCGGFFFPMVLLAVVLFDSFNALNPILIIGSIFRTLLPYCGMVLFFYAGALLFIETEPPINRFWLLPTMPTIFNGVQLYMIIVAVGLLGRFYCRYEKKLNWEI